MEEISCKVAISPEFFEKIKAGRLFDEAGFSRAIYRMVGDALLGKIQDGDLTTKNGVYLEVKMKEAKERIVDATTNEGKMEFGDDIGHVYKGKGVKRDE